MAERRFDWDEAKVKFLAGATLAELGREYGVTSAAIRLAVHDDYRRKQRARAVTRKREHRKWVDECPGCGGEKSKSSALCAECNRELRLSSYEDQVPPPDALAYWPDGRYGLIAVCGQAHASNHWGASFSILDSYDMYREVRRGVASMNTIEQKRAELVALVDEMNRAA